MNLSVCIWLSASNFKKMFDLCSTTSFVTTSNLPHTLFFLFVVFSSLLKEFCYESIQDCQKNILPTCPIWFFLNFVISSYIWEKYLLTCLLTYLFQLFYFHAYVVPHKIRTRLREKNQIFMFVISNCFNNSRTVLTRAIQMPKWNDF